MPCIGIKYLLKSTTKVQLIFFFKLINSNNGKYTQIYIWLKNNNRIRNKAMYKLELANH